jgi:hypothetical protein
MFEVRAHDIWTHKESGNDYAVLSVGIHTETGEETVGFVSYNDRCYYMPLDKFIETHELTHRVYKDY